MCRKDTSFFLCNNCEVNSGFFQLIFVFSIFGYTAFLMTSTGLRLFAAFFATASTYVLICYFFAITHNLDLGVILSTLYGFTISCISLIRKRFDKNLLNKWSFKDLLLLVLVIIISMKMVPNNWRLIWWDEFPSWGANAKALFMDRHLYTLESSNAQIANGFFQNYPPGAAIYQYFFTRIFGWSEGNLLRIQILLTLIGFCVALETVRNFRRVPLAVIFGVVPLILIYNLLSFNLNNILGDGLLGIHFLVLLVMISFYSRANFQLKEFLYLAPVVGVMSLIKPTGIVFSMFSIGVLFYARFLMVESVQRQNKQFSMLLNAIWHQRLFVLISIFFAIGPQMFWSIYLKYHEINNATLKGDLSEIRGIERMFTTFMTFARQFAELRSFDQIQGNALMLISLLLFIAILLIKTRRIFKLDIKILKSLIVCFFLYCFFVYILYLFFMDEYERNSGDSILRYLNSYVLAWTIITILLLLNSIESKYILRFVVVIVAVLNLAILTQTRVGDEIRNLDTTSDKFKVRISVDEVSNRLSALSDNVDKVYVIEQGSTGLKPKIFIYNSMPKQVNWWCWSLGKPLYKGDIWTCDLTLRNQLLDYEFLVVFDSEFKLFSEGLLKSNVQSIEPGIYKVFYEDGLVNHLRPIEYF
jgi:hypothetical protein